VSQTILIVEDDPQDAQTLEKLLRKLGITNPIRRLTSVLEAIAYTRGDLHYADRTVYPLPKIILLDLKMPGMDGFDFMRYLKMSYTEDYHVFVITGLEDVSLIRRSYQHGAKSFLQKPCDLQDLQSLVQAFPAFWMRAESKPLELPGNAATGLALEKRSAP
jgi:CheY-like chemotaxis protein